MPPPSSPAEDAAAAPPPPPTAGWGAELRAGGEWVLFHAALSEEEVRKAAQQLPAHQNGLQSFSTVDGGAPELGWLQQRLLDLAAAADAAAGWELRSPCGALAPTDGLVFDRFGPGFSDTTFAWHRDAAEGDGRLVSVVVYFTDPAQYSGGRLLIRPSGGGGTEELTPRPGQGVAFPSARLEHCVEPVVAGERRSLLLIAGDAARGLRYS
eukprot:TRINITY_DN35950_c0_g1_i1.p2 TRINITY_DN35950_c0_g1~~TRINITY_DN35950_c0_g1_i1.p2  ORF type:complete len:240 (+),score=93.13 TRINITY_DN35950_c0_g1_i1:92-721(+)